FRAMPPTAEAPRMAMSTQMEFLSSLFIIHFYSVFNSSVERLRQLSWKSEYFEQYHTPEKSI
ncbi:MAG: hypothetical protein WAW61_05885, partial [Methylococcaceae bacterium]